MHTSQLLPRPARPSQSRTSHAPSHSGQRDHVFRGWNPAMAMDTSHHYHHIPQLEEQVIHQHRVYLLHCSFCSAFLSDRGMRAVLLLKPSITLFSTDAPPLSSGPQSAKDHSRFEHVERTCECMTQSLACYSCGTEIGYQIVSPCAVCTYSVQQHAKAANGHRYVFHYRAVTFRERKHVPGEPGIVDSPYTTVRVSRQPIRPSPAQEACPPNEHDQRHATPEAIPPDGRRPRAATLCHEVEKELSAPIEHLSDLDLPLRRRPLKGGDTLYWHHLRKGGERLTPVDPDQMVFKPPICGR